MMKASILKILFVTMALSYSLPSFASNCQSFLNHWVFGSETPRFALNHLLPTDFQAKIEKENGVLSLEISQPHPERIPNLWEMRLLAGSSKIAEMSIYSEYNGKVARIEGLEIVDPTNQKGNTQGIQVAKGLPLRVTKHLLTEIAKTLGKAGASAITTAGPTTISVFLLYQRVFQMELVYPKEKEIVDALLEFYKENRTQLAHQFEIQGFRDFSDFLASRNDGFHYLENGEIINHWVKEKEEAFNKIEIDRVPNVVVVTPSEGPFQKTTNLIVLKMPQGVRLVNWTYLMMNYNMLMGRIIESDNPNSFETPHVH